MIIDCFWFEKYIRMNKNIDKIKRITNVAWFDFIYTKCLKCVLFSNISSKSLINVS